MRSANARSSSCLPWRSPSTRNSMRMKNVPPSGSVECWSELRMFASLSNRNPETAATIPRSSELRGVAPIRATTIDLGPRERSRPEGTSRDLLPGGDPVDARRRGLRAAVPADRQDAHADGGALAFELEVPPLEVAEVESGRGVRVLADQHLSRARCGGQPGGHVHRVPEGGEVCDGVRRSDGSDVRRPGVHAGSGRKPWTRRVRVAGCEQQVACGENRPARMLGPGCGDVEADHLVADELVG